MRAIAFSLTFGLAFATIVAACSPTATGGPSTGAQTGLTPTQAPSAANVGASIAPSPAVGFAFDAESIVGYYRTLGYTCTDPQPSSQAAGYLYRSCRLLDADGRIRVVGLVTDTAGDLADAFASVQGKAGETILEPSAALDPLAAFLGATLGPSQGEGLLPWLAGHLGDSYAKTTIADLVVATYSETSEDHSKLYVEIANQAYLDAPRPTHSP